MSRRPGIRGIVLLLAAAVSVPVAAKAFTTTGGVWSGGNFSYRVNAASFVNNIGLGLAASDYENWIATAISVSASRSRVAASS
jgi:hypothetical protein